MIELSDIKRRASDRLTTLTIDLVSWLDRQPRVIRPAVVGAGFIWMLILVRGGYLLPILFVIGLITDPAMLARFLIVALVIAPGAGFLGGLLYGIVSPVTDYLGVIGKVLKFSLAAATYVFVLVVAIMPVLDGKNTLVVPDSSDWWFIGGFGVALGIGLTYAARDNAA